MKYLAIGIVMFVGAIVQAQVERIVVELPPQKAFTYDEYLAQKPVNKVATVTANFRLENRTIVIMETDKALTKSEYNSLAKVPKTEILVNGAENLRNNGEIIILEPTQAISRENYRPGVVEKKEIKVGNPVKKEN